MGIIAYAFGGIGLFLLLDGALLHLGIAAALPWFTPFLAGTTGTLIALVWYFDIKARERAKKKRGKAFTAMMVDICVCILADSKYAFAAGVRGMIWRIQSSNHFICWIFSGK